MKKELYIFIIIQIFFLSCSPQKKKIQPNPNLCTIDLDHIEMKKEVNASVLFKNVKTTILETKDECLIGHIGNIYINDNYIIIFDDYPSNQSVFVFHRDGHFSHKIGNRGGGPGEYISISDFTVDEQNQEIYILDPNTFEIKKYYLQNGKFIGSIPINNKRMSQHIQYCNGELYIDANSKSDEKYLLYQIDSKAGKEIAHYINADQYNQGQMELLFKDNSFFFSRNKEEFKFVQLFMDTIMAIKKDIIIPYIAVKSDRWVRKSEIDEAYKNFGFEGFRKIEEKKRLFGITDFVEFGDVCFFGYSDGFELFNVYYSPKKTFSFRMMYDDLVCKNGEFPINFIKFSDSKGVYAYSYPTLLASNTNKILKEILNPDIEKYEELINLPEESNPVIFYYELR